MWHNTVVSSVFCKMDAAPVSSLYPVPLWIPRFLTEYEDPVDGPDIWAIKFILDEGRQAVWTMCSVMGVDACGVPGQACRLLERYLSAHMREFNTLAVNMTEWQDFKRALASRLPLLIASCVQLATKMCSASTRINASVARACLLCKGIVYSLQEVVSAEFHVFSTLKFHVPLWTSVEAAQMLAAEVGMPMCMMEGVEVMVNIAEFYRPQICESVRAIADVSPSSTLSSTSRLRTPHLVAGGVLAIARYLSFKGRDPAPHMAYLTQAPLSYIKCICDILLTELSIQKEKKRKDEGLFASLSKKMRS